MAYSQEVIHYNSVTDILFYTFGSVADRDTIYSVVESCCGDVNHAANAIMSITSEENPATLPVESTSHDHSSKDSGHATSKKAHSKIKSSTMKCIKDITPSPKMSYAGTSKSKSKETIPKQKDSSFMGFPRIKNHNTWNIWTDQIKRIVTYHNQGTRTLVIMRGAPGSGKSYLARQIQEITVGTMPHDLHIYSTDDYFIINGRYEHNKTDLSYAHTWNQLRACEALDKGISPVIIDNTNVDCWEIFPYANTGVYNGYLIEIVEPNTPWARNVNQLSRKNIHNVPLNTIRRMIQKLSFPITSAALITILGLAYPKDREPPVLRCSPKIVSHSTDNCPSRKINITAQEQEVKNQDAKLGAESNTYTQIMTQKNSTCHPKSQTCELNISPHLNEELKCTLEEDIDSSKVLLDVEKLQLNCDEVIKDDQGEMTNETKEKEIVNDKVETFTISEDQNIKLESQDIHENEPKYEVIPGGKEQMDDKLEANVSLTLKEEYKPSEIKEDQVNIEKLLEEFQRVENEWDNGEAWKEDGNNINKDSIIPSFDTRTEGKLPRKKRTKVNEDPLQTLSVENDWRKIYMPMVTSTDNENVLSITSKNVVEIKSAETCMEVGDTDTSGIKNSFKILSAVARDINLNYLPKLPEKIPENRKFDKSSMTNEITIMSGAHRCRNEDKHFIRFRNMFKHLKKEELRDIFDKCCGDVNWAVSIVMDDVPNNQLECITLDEQSEIEEDSEEPCDCTSFYGVIPDVTPTSLKDEQIFNKLSSSAISTETSIPIRKQKKESPVSDTSLALKRQLEQNIVISDQHYSEQCLKVRKMRRGVVDGDASTSQNISIGITLLNPTQSITNTDACGTDANTQEVSESSTNEVVESECNSDDESAFNEVEKTVNVHLGYEFLNQLDVLFGRGDMGYLENIEPRINMPMSMLNEINALWMESVMSQIEAESRSHEEMIKQDEEFARTLALEQLEVSKSGKEPEVPNLKEIMDMELALSLYRKDCEELMQKDRPTDLATKMSEKKLHDLFPGIPQGDLNEILMAHHYDFRTTVAVLLQSQGRSELVEEENGVNKFIMAQELQKKETFLNAEKKRLMEQKLPELPDEINMETVNSYRSKAKLHYANWNKNFGKAKHMVRKNPAIANYYNNLAGLHLLQCKQANNVAAVTLLQMHARNNENTTSLDLHYLYVEEATTALDVFLDSHINDLRLAPGRNKKYLVLYIITGRGLHSRGGPKIKPAVQAHLICRGLIYTQINPGLLSVTVSSEDRMTYEAA